MQLLVQQPKERNTAQASDRPWAVTMNVDVYLWSIVFGNDGDDV